MILIKRVLFYIIGSLLLSLLSAVMPSPKEGIYESQYIVNTTESQFIWKGSKSSGSSHTGTISLESGEISIFTQDTFQVTGDFILNMESIQNTDIEDLQYNNILVRHLKSDDFFAVDSFPNAYFELQDIIRLEDKKMKHNYTIIGKLKIMDTSIPIEFPAEIKFDPVPIKGASSHITANGTILLDRTRWGIKYKSKAIYKNLGDNYIHDIFTIDFNLVVNLYQVLRKQSPID